MCDSLCVSSSRLKNIYTSTINRKQHKYTKNFRKKLNSKQIKEINQYKSKQII